MLPPPTSIRLRHSRYLRYATFLGIVFGTQQTGAIYPRARPFRLTETGRAIRMRQHWRTRPAGLSTCLLLVQLLG